MTDPTRSPASRLAQLAALLALASGCAAVSPRPVARPIGAGVTNINLLIGERSLDDSDWEPADEQALVGASIDWFYPDSWFRDDREFGYEFSFLHSDEEDTISGTDIEATYNELSFGFRLTFNVAGGRLHPYAGLGISYVEVEADPALGSTGSSEDDRSFGYYSHVGTYWNVAGGFILGLDLRILLGSKIDFEAVSTDGDYTQLAVTLGWSF